MILYSDWKQKVNHTFLNAYILGTDFGVCCLITPWLDFENPHTRSKPATEYIGEDFHSIQRGVKNGLQNGLKLMVDIEVWDYAYFNNEAQGLKLALRDSREKVVVNQVK